VKRGTSEPISTIAGRGLKKPETLTPREIKRVCASALAQDETARKLAAVLAVLAPEPPQ
jgi:hypothetical protein